MAQMCIKFNFLAKSQRQIFNCYVLCVVMSLRDFFTFDGLIPTGDDIILANYLSADWQASGN